MKNKILVIQTSFIGDCILSLPFLSELLRIHPDKEVQVVATPLGAEVFKIASERGFKSQCSKLTVTSWNKKEFHMKTPWGLWRWVQKNILKNDQDIESVFCLQRSLRSGFMAYLSHSKNRIGFSSGGSTLFYTQIVPRDWNSGKSEVEKNLDLLRYHYQNAEIPAWVFNKNAPSLLRAEIEKSKKPRVLIGLGSPWPTKDWPVENIKKFIEMSVAEGVEVVLAGDKSAIEKSLIIEKEFKTPLLKNLCGQTRLAEWIDEIEKSTLVVSGDSATVHVASDLGVPVLALFGPTVPDFGFAPWRQPSLVLGVKNLECRPCDIHGPKVCPLGHHKCMVDITPQKVFSFATDIIEKRRT